MVWALLLSGSTVSVIVLIGVVMLAGIVVKNAIVLVDCINRLRRDGMDKAEAIVAGGRIRLRPILMTTLTTILALTPMALGLGEGAEIRGPMAITVIGGLLVSTALDADRDPDRLLGVRSQEVRAMSLPRLSVNRPVTTAMVLLSLLVLGGISFTRIPLAFLPDVDFPAVFVSVPYPNASPRQIEREIARPLEEALATIPGARRISSTATADSAELQPPVHLGGDGGCGARQGVRGGGGRPPRSPGRCAGDLREHLLDDPDPGPRGPDLRPGQGPFGELRAAGAPDRRSHPADPRGGAGRG